MNSPEAKSDSRRKKEKEPAGEKMNVSQIRYFLELVRYKSFKKAAEGLYISQPALSQQISALEKEWGMKLFIRKYKEVELTPSGRIMFEMLNSAKEEYYLAMSRALNAVGDIKTVISIGVPEYCDLANLPEILSEYQDTHPNLLLNIESCPISMLTLPRNNDRFDLVINQEYLLMNRKEIGTRLLAERRHMFFISGKHPAVQGKEEITLKDLNGLRLYLPGQEQDENNRDYCRLICENSGFVPGEIIYQQNANSVLLSAKMCFGVTLLDDLITIPEEYRLLGFQTTAPINWLIAWKGEDRRGFLGELVEKICSDLQW